MFPQVINQESIKNRKNAAYLKKCMIDFKTKKLFHSLNRNNRIWKKSSLLTLQSEFDPVSKTLNKSKSNSSDILNKANNINKSPIK